MSLKRGSFIESTHKLGASSWFSRARAEQKWLFGLTCAVLLLVIPTLGVAWPLGVQGACQTFLFGLASLMAGLLIGFFVSYTRADNEVIARIAQSVAVLIGGASLSGIMLEGGTMLETFAADLRLSRAAVVSVLVAYSVSGFLFSYFYKQLSLNIHMARRRLDLDMLLEPNGLASVIKSTTLEALTNEMRAAVDAVTSDHAAEPRNHYEQTLAVGVALKARGEFQSALLKLEEAKQMKAEDYRVWLALSATYIAVGNQARATTCVLRAVDLAPRDADSALLLACAEILSETRQDEKADQYYSRYLAVHNLDKEACLGYAKLRVRLATTDGGTPNEEENERILDLLQIAAQDTGLRRQIEAESQPGGAFHGMLTYDQRADRLRDLYKEET